ncbi:MAG TPA: FkbM family methyltransferase [Tepidisphaeraceae bacterium]|jgi:FkbM family methyltransferase
MANLPQQVVEPFNRLKDCRHGKMLYNFHDQYVGRSLDLYGEYSEAEFELFRQIVRPGDVVVEVGANLGAHTIPLAKLTGSHGAVIAYEPQRVVYQTLCANVALNDLIHVFTNHAAVGTVPGVLNVPILDPTQDQNFGGYSMMGHPEGESVPLVILDALNLVGCRLLKVDVEGMELDVLQGAANLIRAFHPAMYVENDRSDRTAELTQFIASLGYDMFSHDPPLFNPNNYFNNPENVFGKIVSRNLFCVPQQVSHMITGLPRVEPVT